MKAYGKPSKPAKLRLVAGEGTEHKTKKPKKYLRAGGTEPAKTMEPGRYVVICEGATVEPYHGGTRAVLSFRVFEGPHEGTALSMWIKLKEIAGFVVIRSRYGKQAKVALDREIEPGEDLDPGKIFDGRVFLAEVSYRKTMSSRGGEPDDALALRRKADDDLLRVCDLIELREL